MVSALLVDRHVNLNGRKKFSEIALVVTEKWYNAG